MNKLAILSLFVAAALATPDCYDESVSRKVPGYMDVLPSLLYYGQVDYMEIDAGANCAYYTYRDTLFRSYSSSITGIYFVFYKGDDYQCNLDNSLESYPEGKWLYANTFFADPSVCGYFVGIANSGAESGMFQIIRTSAEDLRITLTATALVAATYFLNLCKLYCN